MDEFKLQTDPPERIVFRGDKLGEEYVVTNLKITNPTEGRVAYMVRFTSNDAAIDIFRTCPHVGVIKPARSDIVMLQFKAGNGIPQNGLHYFVIQYIKAEDETKTARTCWLGHKGETEATKRMFVYFEKEEENNNEEQNDTEQKDDNDEETEDNEKDED